MYQDAKSVIQTACEFLINYQDEAVQQAELRARDEESARWPVIADTIRMISDAAFMPFFRPPNLTGRIDIHRIQIMALAR